MGLCGSKSSSARSTAGSEKSAEKCRWDKHGNVFFPVRRHFQHQPRAAEEADTAGSFMKQNSFRTTNPVFVDFESNSQGKSSHFASITKFLKATTSKNEKLEEDPLSGSRTQRAAYRVVKAFRGGPKAESTEASTKFKVTELDKKANPTSLSRSSSAKEGTLTRSSSAKEAALSRCSSEKDCKREIGAIVLETGAELLASLKAPKQKPKEPTDNVDSSCKEAIGGSEKPLDSTSVEAVVKSKLGVPVSNDDATTPATSFLTNGLGLPSYRSLVFSAGSSPEKCRGRVSSTHSSLSSDEMATAIARHRRRRSPNRVSPSRRSPNKRSPNKRAGNNGITLNSSAARFQRSLPNRTAENMPPQSSAEILRSQIRNAKNNSCQERSVLRELPRNSMKPDNFQPAKMVSSSLPPKARSQIPPALRPKSEASLSDKVTKSQSSGTAFGASVLNGDARCGSKRLRSPRKQVASSAAKEYLNFNVAAPAGKSTSGRFTKATCESPSEDKHVEYESQSGDYIQEKNVVGHPESGSESLQERELLELLERTPKKLKKMALKLALMIELEHCKEEEEDIGGTVSRTGTKGQTVQTNNSVDLELKLGMPNEKSRSKQSSNKDGISFGVSVALDSPGRAGSVSLPMTPRHSISSICNGLSVEARIGSSKGDISCSDISIHILKNPDKLFGCSSRPQDGKATANVMQDETRGSKASGAQRDHVSSAVDQKDCPATGPMKANESASQVERCSSFGFEHDKPVQAEAAVGDDKNSQSTTMIKREQLLHKGKLDLNQDASWVEQDVESSPAFEFKLKPKSSPATPMMPPAKEETEDALSLSADEIAEIWGAFEAGQATTPVTK